LSHERSFSNKKDLRFVVKWKGFSDKDNTVAPYQNLKSNAILHQYLITNKQYNLIPYENRKDYIEVFSNRRQKRK
jgi:hypothetical protein